MTDGPAPHSSRDIEARIDEGVLARVWKQVWVLLFQGSFSDFPDHQCGKGYPWAVSVVATKGTRTGVYESKAVDGRVVDVARTSAFAHGDQSNP